MFYYYIIDNHCIIQALSGCRVVLEIKILGWGTIQLFSGGCATFVIVFMKLCFINNIIELHYICVNFFLLKCFVNNKCVHLQLINFFFKQANHFIDMSKKSAS